MKILKKQLHFIALLIISLLFIGSKANATVYNWTGATSTVWTLNTNWLVNGSTALTYPGLSATDTVAIGVSVSYYHYSSPVTTRQPTLGAGYNLTIAAMIFGDNGVPAGNYPGNGDIGYNMTLTVNGNITISGSFTQKHSAQGIAGTGNTTTPAPLPYTFSIFDNLQGAGTITCGSFVIGDNTVPTNDNVIGITKFRIGSNGQAITININGDFTCYTSIRGDGTAANNIISLNCTELSFGGGTINVYGKINLIESTNTFTAKLGAQYVPLIFFYIDLFGTTNPTLNLYNSSPFNIQTGSVRNNVDFYNVFQTGSSGVCTVNYAGVNPVIATYKSSGSYNNFIDHNYVLLNNIATSTISNSGSGYVDGTYTNVPLTTVSGSGAGALANITVSGGAVTAVSVISGYGSNYAVGNTLSAATANLGGGSGSGFQLTVATVNATTTFGGVYQNLSFSGSGTATTDISNGTLSVLGNMTINSGTVNISTNAPTFTLGGNLTIANGATFIKSDGTALSLNGTVTNGGTFTHSGASTITYNGALVNQSTGAYNESGGGNVITNNYAFSNAGTFNQSSSSLATFNKAFNNTGIYNFSGSGAFTAASTTANGGTFNHSASTLATFTGVVSNTGNINQSAAGNILFSSTFTNSGGSSAFSQTGASTTTFTGAVNNDGTITQNNASGIFLFPNSFTNTLSGSRFTLTNGTSTFSNAYSNTGTFKQSGGTVNFNQATSQNLTDNSTGGTTFSNVNMKNGGTITLSGSGQFYISDVGLLNMSNNTTLASGNILTISSDVNGSGTVTALPSGCAITGNVTVQRYLSANRAYRLLSSPVNAGTDGNGNKYYGVNYLLTNTVLTGSGGVAGGFSKAGNPTLYLWRENLVPINSNFFNGNFIGIADITNPASYGFNDTTYPSEDIPVGNGYLFYYRGSIKKASLSALTTAGAVATTDTLNAVGTLNAGSITVHPWFTPGSANLAWSTTDAGDASVQGINLVGNPYASSIDWDQFSDSNSSAAIYGPNLSGFSFQLIPTGAQGAGNYNVYLAGSHSAGTQGVVNSNLIASGEGFMVQALNGSAALTFNESAKTNTQNIGANLYMGKPVANNNTPQYLRLQLALDTINADGTIIRFNQNAKTTFNPAEDAHYKNGTGKVNLSSLSSDNVPVAYNQLPLALKGDTIRLNIKATVSGNYSLNIKDLVGIPQLYNVFLVDALKKDTTDLRKNKTYNFAINTADTSTFGRNRFSLIINQNPSLQYKLLTFTGSQVANSKHVQLAWSAVNEQNYTHFTVERSTDNGKTFNVIGGLVSTGAGTYSLLDKFTVDGDNQYRLKQEDFNNNVTYSNIVDITITAKGGNDHLTCYPNPATSNFSVSFVPKTGAKTFELRISNSAGIVVKYAVLNEPNWQGNVSSFLTGSYLVQVIDKHDNSIIGQAKFVKL